jgi:outer membrane protein assembly factor BamE (lipoprotein component of BamABCDE complex)
MRVKGLTAAALVVTALAASGCTRIRDTQGYIVDEQLIGALQPGVDNKASVQQSLGRPSLNSQFDDTRWYYISRNTRQTAFFRPQPIAQKIVIVSFDPKGNVAKVEQRGMEKIANIDPVNDKTRTLGRKGGFFRDLFGGIGAVGTSQAVDPTKQ